MTTYLRRLAAFAAGARTVRRDSDPQGPDDPQLRQDFTDGRQAAHLLTGYHYADARQVTVPLLPFTAYRLGREPRALTLATPWGHPNCPHCGGQGAQYVHARYSEDDDNYTEEIEYCTCTEPVLRLPLPATTPLRTARAAAGRLLPASLRTANQVTDWNDEPPF